jgi:hypothetical protein
MVEVIYELFQGNNLSIHTMDIELDRMNIGVMFEMLFSNVGDMIKANRDILVPGPCEIIITVEEFGMSTSINPIIGG